MVCASSLRCSLLFPPRSHLACELAFTAVKTVSVEKNGKMEIDIKRYARVEKVHASGSNMHMWRCSSMHMSVCVYVCACVCVCVCVCVHLRSRDMHMRSYSSNIQSVALSGVFRSQVVVLKTPRY